MSDAGVDPDRGPWFAARRVAEPGHDPGHDPEFLRLRGQPPEGFATAAAVLEWLIDQGLVTADLQAPDAEAPRRGWGHPYCAVLGSRDDPWEPDTP